MKTIRPQLDELGLTLKQLALETGYSWISIQRYSKGTQKISDVFMRYLDARVVLHRLGFKPESLPILNSQHDGRVDILENYIGLRFFMKDHGVEFHF